MDGRLTFKADFCFVLHTLIVGEDITGIPAYTRVYVFPKSYRPHT